MVEMLIVNMQSGDQTAPNFDCCCFWYSYFFALDATTDDYEKKSNTKYITQEYNHIFNEKMCILVRYLNIHTRK